MNIITNLLFILGSLGVFLFGMKILSQGIQQAAGDKMRKIMATMTHNRLLGIGTGFLTTCILQSSSARRTSLNAVREQLQVMLSCPEAQAERM